MPNRLRSAVLNLLTLLTLAATGLVIAVVAAIFLAPGAVPAFLVAPTQPAQVSAITPLPTTAAPIRYPPTPPGPPLQAPPPLPGPAVPVDANIKPEGNHLRLRASPGTAGTVISFLPAQMTLHLIGRTDDNVWLQVITADKQQGWVLAQYV